MVWSGYFWKAEKKLEIALVKGSAVLLSSQATAVRSSLNSSLVIKLTRGCLHDLAWQDFSKDCESLVALKLL